MSPLAYDVRWNSMIQFVSHVLPLDAFSECECDDFQRDYGLGRGSLIVALTRDVT
jgi:hypothetical protein